jgi:hypothetical protein
MFDMNERNARLDKMGDYFEKNEVTIDDILAVVCGKLINTRSDNLKTKLMVAGRIFEIEFKEVAK